MGLLDFLTGGGKEKTQSQTTQTGTSYAPWISGAQQGVAGAAGAMAAPFLRTPQYGLAGFTPDQLKGFDLARGVAQNAFAGSPVRAVGGAPTMATTTNVGFTNAGLTNGMAQQLNPADITAMMNPYVSNVVAPAMDGIRRQKNAAGAAIGARSAAGASFGGSGETLQRALLDRSTTETAAQTVAQLMSAGYDQATATAMANVANRQQAEMANAQAANAVAQFNARSANDAAAANAAAANTTSQFNATQGADFALRAPTIEDGLANNAQTRQMNALQLLLSGGATQQQLAQQGIDLPWTNLQRLAALVPPVYDQTGNTVETAPDNSPGFLQQILGVGATVAGMGVPGGGTILGSFFK